MQYGGALSGPVTELRESIRYVRYVIRSFQFQRTVHLYCG